MTTKDGKDGKDAAGAEPAKDTRSAESAEDAAPPRARERRDDGAGHGKDSGRGGHAEKGDEGDDSGHEGSGAGHDGPGAPDRISMPELMRAVTAQLSELLRAEPAGVSALKSTEDGWTAQVEVVEVERIPDTTSVMASYRVDLDRGGRLVAYERVSRYARGRVDR